MNYFRILFVSLILVVSSAKISFAQVRSQEMIEVLKGKESTAETAAGKSRSFVPRSARTKNVEKKATRTRTLYLSRGLSIDGASPKAAFFGDPTTKVTEVRAPSQNPNVESKGDLGISAGEDAYLVEYKVDPSSKLKGEIFFNKGSSEIKTGTGSTRFLIDLAVALRSPELTGMKFIIEGHASADGDAIKNKILSQQRADTIHKTLVSYGVSPVQVFAAGFGEDEAQYPAYADDSLLAKDRRVLIYKLEN